MSILTIGGHVVSIGGHGIALGGQTPTPTPTPAPTPTPTPTPSAGVLVSFAGAAGSPTGTQVITQFNSSVVLTNARLDGAGHAVFDTADQLGPLNGLGTQPDGRFTWAIVPGGVDYRLLARVTPAGNTAYLFEYAPGGVWRIVSFLAGTYNVLATGPTAPAPTASLTVVLAGSSISLLCDGSPVGSVTDTSIPADGAIGLGGNGVSYSSISYQSAAQYAAANPPSMTVTGAG